MVELVKIIKDDFTVVGQALRGIVRGAVQGIYTPALMNTGMRQFFNETGRSDKSKVEIIAKDITQLYSTFGVYLPLTVYSIEQGRGLELLGALAVTNSIDYVAHAVRRSKK